MEMAAVSSGGAHPSARIPPLAPPHLTCCASRHSARPSACCSSCWRRRRRRCTCKYPRIAAAGRAAVSGDRGRGHRAGPGQAALTSAISACLASNPFLGVRVRETAGSGAERRGGVRAGTGERKGDGGWGTHLCGPAWTSAWRRRAPRPPRRRAGCWERPRGCPARCLSPRDAAQAGFPRRQRRGRPRGVKAPSVPGSPPAADHGGGVVGAATAARGGRRL